MLSKVIKGHFLSLKDDTSSPRRSLALHYGVPLIAGVFFSASHFPAAYKLDILNAVSIITGLLFSLIVFLIQLRYQFRVGIDQTHKEPLQKDNLDYSFGTSIYAIILGLGIVLAILLQQFGGAVWPSFTIGKQVSNAVIVGGFLHFVITISLVLKRLWRVYDYYGRNK